MNSIGVAKRIGFLVLALSALLLIHGFYMHHKLGGEALSTLWGLNLLYYSKFIAEVPSKEQKSIEGELLAGLDELRTVAPRLAPGTGFYDREITVTVSGAVPGIELRYTSDGSVPTRKDPRVVGDLSIGHSTVLRVKAFEEGRLPSATATATYILGYQRKMPVVSLVLDPVYLYNRRAGIYSNPLQQGRAWERPAEFAMLSTASEVVLQAESMVRIHGDRSRGQPKKSFRLYFGPDDGDLRSWFGPDAEIISPKQGEWVLRHVTKLYLYRDRLATMVARQMGLPVSPMVPAVLYLNGEIWGVYDLMERVNAEFIAGKMPAEQVTLLRGPLADPIATIGNRDAWEDIYEYVGTADLTAPIVYNQIEKSFDLVNLIDFWIFQIFIADDDRPDSNMDVFRTSESGPWRFLVWDSDSGFNYRGTQTNHDTFAWHIRDKVRPDLKTYGSPDSDWQVRSTLLFRKLMTNHDFRQRFRSRFQELLSTVLSTESLIATFEQLLATYDEVRDIESLGSPDDSRDVAATDVDQQIEMIRNFIAERPAVMREQVERNISEP